MQQSIQLRVLAIVLDGRTDRRKVDLRGLALSLALSSTLCKFCAGHENLYCRLLNGDVPLPSGLCDKDKDRFNCSRNVAFASPVEFVSVLIGTTTCSPSTSTSASGSGTRIPSTGTFIVDAEDEELSCPRMPGGGDPERGVADTDGALLYTRRLERDGAECSTGGTRREGVGTGIGAPTDGVCDRDRECGDGGGGMMVVYRVQQLPAVRSRRIKRCDRCVATSG